MRKLLFAVSLLLSLAMAPEPSFAQTAFSFPKPAGVPTIVLPDYGVTIGVWAVKYPFGGYLGFFVFNPLTNQWNAPSDNDNGAQDGDPNFDNSVSVMGAPIWLKTVGLPGVNKALANQYPPKGGAPAPVGNLPLDQVNTALSGYTIRMVNGIPTVGLK